MEGLKIKCAILNTTILNSITYLNVGSLLLVKGLNMCPCALDESSLGIGMVKRKCDNHNQSFFFSDSPCIIRMTLEYTGAILGAQKPHSG